jgi:acetylornithine deacetylase/succinyl-diaminopimelate desuccinylase-like protein
MGSMIAALGNGNGPTLLYDAHMDTVAATAPERGPSAVRAAIEIARGLGAVDMKAPLPARSARANSPTGPAQHAGAGVVFGRTCEGLAIRMVIEEDGLRPDFALIGEPTNLHISRGQRGRVMFKVTVEGQAAHGSQPERGQNAIYAAARLVFAVQLLAGDLPRDPFLGPGTIAVTAIESRGASLNAIPDRCKVFIET